MPSIVDGGVAIKPDARIQIEFTTTHAEAVPIMDPNEDTEWCLLL